ncbi:MAG: adenylate/guanylate cyclase domain-containing protein [Fimbriimonadaceae bacterium]
MKWIRNFVDDLTEECLDSLKNSPQTRDQVPKGWVTPALEDLTLGGAKEVIAAALFFDIRGFTKRVDSDELDVRLAALATLNAVVTVVSRVIFENGGYVEKNTGDGVMAIVGIEDHDQEAVQTSLIVAMQIFAALKNVVNPVLAAHSIPTVDARIGVDFGKLLIARLGLPTGRSDLGRNFLTAVGATANIACKLQQAAGTNEIWVGDAVRKHCAPDWQGWFEVVTPDDWIWIWTPSGEKYHVWKFTGRFTQIAP